jgi:ribulose-5-phosphate 4-epimerase/fuculose-1-phosphate aldolase
MNNIPAVGLASLREHLVAANHILVREGVLDAFGHVSARTSAGAGEFLLARNLAPGSVTASDLVVHDLDGAAADDPRPLYLERYIHAEIYRSRPDVMAIVHSHSASVIPFGLGGVPMRPVFHMAGFLPAEGAPVYEISDHVGGSTDLLISSPELGTTLASALGDQSVVLMRGHGSVTVGTSIPEGVFNAVYAEVNAGIQLRALALGTIRYLSEGEAAAACKSVGKQVRRAWNVWCDSVSMHSAEI